MAQQKTSREARLRRHQRVRKKVHGTAERPRLNVFRSLSQVYAQVIDDATGRTLAAASSMEPELRAAAAGKKKIDVSRLVGDAVAKRSLERGVTKVVFDRGGYMYHGRVKALADAAREAGLQF